MHRLVIVVGCLLGVTDWATAQQRQPIQDPAVPPRPGPGSVTSQHKELIPALVEALKDKDVEVRQAAAQALANLGQEAVKPLLDALKGDDKAVRAGVIEALGKIGPLAQDAIPTLIKSLKDEDKEVRRQAAVALGAIAKSPPYWRVVGTAIGPNLPPPPLPPDGVPAPKPPAR